MTYRITGLDPAPYKPLFGLSDEALAKLGIVRMAVTDATFPCRVSLTDRAIGEKVLLLNHVSHDIANPYRASHAIFVTETEQEPAIGVAGQTTFAVGGSPLWIAIGDVNGDGKLDTAVTIGAGAVGLRSGRSFTVTTLAQSDRIELGRACESGQPVIFTCTGP